MHVSTQKTRTGKAFALYDRTRNAALALVLLLLACGWPTGLSAQEVCTTEATYNIARVPIISNIAEMITVSMVTASFNLFSSITDADSGFYAMVVAACILYVAIYGVMFMTGMIQLSGGDATIRVLKIAAILTLFSPDGWEIFYSIIGVFFIEGTIDLIAAINEIMMAPFTNTGGIFSQSCGWQASALPGPVGPGAIDLNGLLNPPPLYVLDCAAQQIFSADFGITLMASVMTGPYGIMFAILLLVGMFIFLGAVGSALWIFFMFLVVMTLLIGMGPIFLTFMLFGKTRHLFEGWISQMVNYSLQPIFLFSFLGIYTSILTATLANILNVEKCWSTFQNIIGTNVEIHFWRFMRPLDPGNPNSPLVQDNSSHDFTGRTGAAAGEEAFPIDILDVLIFILVAHLAWRFSKFVVYIAKEISGSFLMLTTMPGSLSSWAQQTRGRIGQSISASFGGHSTSSGSRGVGGIPGAVRQFGQTGRRRP